MYCKRLLRPSVLNALLRRMPTKHYGKINDLHIDRFMDTMINRNMEKN